MGQLTQMPQQNNLIKMHFKGYEEFVSRILDLQKQAVKTRNVVFTPFLNAHEQEIVEAVANEVFVYADGGYPNSEAKRMALSYFEEDVIFPIVCLSDTFDEKYHSLTHRDVLGAIMNLGIERKMIGDIFIEGNRIYIFVCEENQTFLMQHLTQIKRAPIVLKEYEGEVERVIRLEKRNCIIASYRLDVVVAAMAKVNREKAKQLIHQGNVKVNQVVLEQYAYLCHNNSTVSIKGYGRFLLTYENQKTKKDRFVVTVGKYV